MMQFTEQHIDHNRKSDNMNQSVCDGIKMLLFNMRVNNEKQQACNI